MTLLHPLWLAPAVVLLLAYVFIRNHPDDDWQQVIERSVLRFLQGIYLSKGKLNRSKQRAGKRHLELLMAAVVCAALSAPSIQAEKADTFRHSQGWIILADVSRSMTLNDVVPSRLSAMRNAALEITERARANSTTLIIYAGDAFIVSPPSFDDTSIQQNITLLDHGIVPLEGSSLTRALSLALSVIESSQLVNTRLFILSDTGGFNNRSDAVVSRLATLGHRSDVILFGEESFDTAAPFDIPMAKAIANSGKGALVRSDSLGQVDFGDLDLQSNLSDNSLLTSAGLTSIRWQNQSHWLLLLAVPLMLRLFHEQWHQ